MNSNHTAAPWAWSEIDPEDKDWGACEIVAGRELVCTHVIGVDNAKRIVQCVNVHDDLVDALREADIALEAAPDSMTKQIARLKIRSAIYKAREVRHD
jgi:hypothetical protein